MGKSILLSGACGSGKSTLMALGYRALEVHSGPTATIDTDTILMMVDPRWELAHKERRYELAGYQCWLPARSFLTAGFGCVIIGGNGLHTPEEINGLVTLLLSLGEVYHDDPRPLACGGSTPRGRAWRRPHAGVGGRPRRVDAG